MTDQTINTGNVDLDARREKLASFKERKRVLIETMEGKLPIHKWTVRRSHS